MAYVANEISKNKYWELKHQLDHLKFWICYINEFVQELLYNVSICYYGAHKV